MKLLRKIIDAIIPISRREFGLCMTEVTNILDGLKTANGQQAEMLASLVNQVSGLHMKKAEKQTEEEDKVKYDEAFQ